MWLIDFLGILFFKKKRIKGIIEVIKPEYAFLISEDRTIGDILIPLKKAILQLMFIILILLEQVLMTKT